MLETLAGNQTSHAHDSERDLNDPSILFLEDHEDAENTVNPIQSRLFPLQWHLVDGFSLKNLYITRQIS